MTVCPSNRLSIVEERHASHGVEGGHTTPEGLSLARFRLILLQSPLGLPVLRLVPVCIHAIANTPAELMKLIRSCSLISVGLPSFLGGSAPALPVSGPAQRSLTLRPVCS